jgi:hypothetical protein
MHMRQHLKARALAFRYWVLGLGFATPPAQYPTPGLKAHYRLLESR